MGNPTTAIDRLNNMDMAGFVELLGGIFEHSPWVAERVYSARPFASRADLHHKMVAEVRKASVEQRTALLCQHPELAGKEADAGRLTDASRREQAGAGLNQCSADELTRIKHFNQAYAAKFGFPFIIAVSGLDKQQILAAMQQRLDHAATGEFATALAEVEKIALIRLGALIDE
ncbi:MAG TPA: 2-oxo-4-hydroxy-4-carboxy-5-ureidoimidazoline decarboxylase [Gammaproteobacteria bacterium]|nr:2-oxo-4-hydroxy-4-carboxy-5-ureidoimidazoline decarboxylase [Gammaproteobacteria bacterium]